DKQHPMENHDFVREAFSVKTEALEKHHHAPAPETGGAAGGHEHPTITIAKKDIHFYSNWTPKYGNYFAIYFTLTGLHGLHVVAGALVLAHFLLFGKRIYDKDPEHLANRVEVGGLFWHF